MDRTPTGEIVLLQRPERRQNDKRRRGTLPQTRSRHASRLPFILGSKNTPVRVCACHFFIGSIIGYFVRRCCEIFCSHTLVTERLSCATPVTCYLFNCYSPFLYFSRENYRRALSKQFGSQFRISLCFVSSSSNIFCETEIMFIRLLLFRC